MRLKRDRRIQALFWLLTLVPIFFAMLTWRFANQTIEATNEVTATNGLVRKLESFISRVKDVEVDQREFVLTGEETYAEDVRKVHIDLEARLDELKKLKADDNWLEILRTLVQEKFRQVDATVALRRAGDITAAAATLSGMQEGEPMDDIRRSVRAMIDHQNRVLEERSEKRNQKFTYVLAVAVVVLLVNSALIWTLFFSVRRESRNFRRINEELEERVEQRTRDLRKSNEELQQFAFIASHDLKEPMRMISSYASLLQRRYQGQLDEDADTYIQFITDGVRRMNRLITDLLDYSRAGQIPEEQKAPVSPEEVLSSVLQDMQPRIQEVGAQITHDPLPRIWYEPVRLTQLLQSLISSSLKYRRPEVAPVIHISAAQRPREITFSVRDNGVGIAPEHQEGIFAIFTRLHGSDVEGTGIGLATCKKIVEEHGGRIWVESVPGAGSTFRFTVPVQNMSAQKRAASI